MTALKFAKPGQPKKRSKTKEEKAHLNWSASQPCMIPGCNNPVNLHHVRECGSKRDHFRVIPLCHYHHQGQEGIHHTGKSEWRKRFGSEQDMLAELMSRKAEN